MNDFQPRQPEGIPSGGQFATKDHAGDDVAELTAPAPAPAPSQSSLYLHHMDGWISDMRDRQCLGDLVAEIDDLDENSGAKYAVLEKVYYDEEGVYQATLYDADGKQMEDTYTPSWGLTRNGVPSAFAADASHGDLPSYRAYDDNMTIDLDAVRGFDFEEDERKTSERCLHALVGGMTQQGHLQAAVVTDNIIDDQISHVLGGEGDTKLTAEQRNEVKAAVRDDRRMGRLFEPSWDEFNYIVASHVNSL